MEDWVEMERLARRAMALDRQDARAAMLVGIAQFMQGETEHGRIMLERAIRLNPSLAIAYASIEHPHPSGRTRGGHRAASDGVAAQPERLLRLPHAGRGRDRSRH